MALDYQAVVDNQKGMTPEQLAQQSNTITSQQLKPQPVLDIPTPPPPSGNPDAVAASVAATQPSLQSYITALTPPPTAADQQQQGILDSIASLTGQDTGKQQYELQQQQAQGVNDLQKSLTDLNGQQTVGQAEYNQIQTEYRNALDAPAVNGGVAGPGIEAAQNSAVTRTYNAKLAAKSSQLALVAARAQAVSGNIQTALLLAQRATEAKYAPIEDALKVRQTQLEALQPILSKQEKVQAAAIQRQYDDQQRTLQDKKDNEKIVQNIMLQAAQSGADQGTLDRIQGSSTPAEAISVAGYTLGSEFRQKVAQQEFDNKLKLQQFSLDKAQVAVSQGNLSLSRERLNFEKTKEAFDEAVKLAGASGAVTRDANGKPIATPTATPVMQQALAKSNIDLIGSLVTDKGLDNAVGPNFLTRDTNILTKLFNVDSHTGATSNFIAGVEQLRSQLNLDTLIKAKANGATFGALSDNELQVLANAATKLGQWAIKKDGKVTGYDANEVDFRRELDKINNFAKLDYVLKGGNPADVNIKQEADGTFTTKNSDGSITNLGN